MTAKEHNTVEAPIRLSFRSVESVIIEPDDKDRFLMTAKEVARACQRADDAKGWQEDFNQFLHHLRAWCEQRTDKVSACYVCVGDGTLNIVVRTTTEAYDFQLEDDLSTLDVELVQHFDWLIAEVLQVARGVDESQFKQPDTIVVYGNERSTSRAG